MCVFFDCIAFRFCWLIVYMVVALCVCMGVHMFMHLSISLWLKAILACAFCNANEDKKQIRIGDLRA